MKSCVLCKKSEFEILFDHHKNWKVGKCLSCGLVQVVPMPTGAEIESLYHEDLEHFEPYIEQLAVHRQYFRKKIEEIHQLGIASRQSRLLDIGCAMGVLLEQAKKVGWKPVGVDLSNDAVSYCKAHGLIAYTGTVQSVASLKPNSFDVVTAFQVIEHERDPLGMMKRIRQLLKPGGVVVLATPNHASFWRALMGKRWLGFAHPEHVTFWDPQSLTELYRRAGFGEIDVKKDTPRPFPLSFAFMRAADYFPWLGWLFKPIGRFLDHFDLKNPINPWDDIIAFGTK